MNGLMKALVVVASVVAIAAGGHYLWTSYQLSVVREAALSTARQAVSDRTMRQAARRACAPHMTGELGEAKRNRDRCREEGTVTYSEQLDAEGGKRFIP